MAHQTARTTEQIAANAERASKVAADVRQLAQRTKSATDDIGVMVREINEEAERAEGMFDAATDFHAKTSHDEIRAVAQNAAREVGKLFEQAIASAQISEAALFDRNYKPILNTNPQKNTSAFDAFTDRALPAIQERILDSMPQLAYVGAEDDKGYFPTHNRKFFKPLTGDYETDLVNNHTKRIFNDRTGARCAASTKPFLLQTYKRDTGEVMHDLSVPIYVSGRHWGTFRMGYLLSDPNSRAAQQAVVPNRQAITAAKRAPAAKRLAR